MVQDKLQTNKIMETKAEANLNMLNSPKNRLTTATFNLKKEKKCWKKKSKT